MPIYEYKCENSHVFDVMQRMADDPLTACVECGAPVRKVLQPVGIFFKGSGFYSTDYSKKDPKPDSKDSVQTGSEGDSSGDGKNNGGSTKESETTASKGSSGGSSGSSSGGSD